MTAPGGRAGAAGLTLAGDLGGTRMRAALIDAAGRVVREETRPTPRDAPTAAPFADLLARVGAGAEVAAAVVGIAGRIDHARGLAENAPNLPGGWVAGLRADALGERLGVPVQLANDADLACVGEAFFGAARGAADVVYMTVSTGLGAGALVGGRLVRGRRSVAEVGHAVLDLTAALAGRPSTCEELGSGTAAARHAAEAGLRATPAELVALVRAGDARAIAAWERTTRAVGHAARNLAWLFGPEVIVVGGGLVNAGDLLLDPVRAILGARRPEPLPDPVPVRRAELGDRAGLVGAAAWGRAAGGA
mgnify:FL=1